MRATLITAAGSRRAPHDVVDSTPVVEGYRTRSAARRDRMRDSATPAEVPATASERIAS